MKKFDRSGFTLVELLAVVVILVIIMLIAVPNISSSIERKNQREDEAMKETLVSAGELFVSANYDVIRENLDASSVSQCKILIEDLISDRYLPRDDVSGYDDGCLLYDGSHLEYRDDCNSTYIDCVDLNR